MSDDPIDSAGILSGVNESELSRRAAQLQLAVPLDDPLVRPLLWSFIFDRWPDLLPEGSAIDDRTRFYNRYYWFVRFISQWQAAHGSDRGLEQQARQILETGPDDVDWDVVERLDQRARATG